VSGETNFDDLIGPEVTGDERERLRRTHDLLVSAGAPPELSPELEAGPTLAMTLGRRPGHVRRRLILVAAAIVAVALVFLGGYVTGNRGGGSSGVAAVRTLQLRGTTAAPTAIASLALLPAEAGNWPMTLSVTGLPPLPADGYYEVYLVRGGRPWASCGTFVVADASKATVVTLNAPYQLRASDSWVVTRQPAGTSAPGQTVLRQSA
jgi:Anti-sigma-K factor rskA, C-terminal